MTDTRGELSNAGAFWTALRSAAYSVCETRRHAPAWLVKLIVANLALAVTPAAQVLAVAWLIRSSAGGGRVFLIPLVVLTFLVGVGQVIGQATNMTQQRVRIRMRRHYQAELLRAVTGLPPQRLALSETTALIEGCRASLSDLAQLVGSVIASAGAVVTTAVLCATVWTISPVAGVLVGVALVPSLLVFAWEAKMQDATFLPYGQWERRSNYAVEQLVTQRTATELVTLGSGGTVAEIADAHRARADSLLDRILRLVIRADTIGGTGTAVLLGAALAGIVLRGAGGAGIAGGIVGVLSGMQATRAAGFSFGDVISFAPKVEAYRRLLAAAPEETMAARQVVIAQDAETLEALDLSINYPMSDTPAVSEVSLRVEKGQIIALVGVNGAGKTTMINAIMGLLDLDAGTVILDQVETRSLSTSQRLGYFGLLTQEFGRYEFTVRDVIRIGRPDGRATDQQIWRALESAHAGSFVASMSDGLDTQLGSQFGGVGLSGGQWQRLALARVYLRNAPIWILDEPTSAIDAEAEQQIFAELQRTKTERITVVVSHRAWTLKGMDRIYVFDHGRIIEQGTYDQLLSHNGRFSEIFGCLGWQEVVENSPGAVRSRGRPWAFGTTGLNHLSQPG